MKDRRRTIASSGPAPAPSMIAPASRLQVGYKHPTRTSYCGSIWTVRVITLTSRLRVKDCPGQKPPFLAVKRPVRPYKSAIQKRVAVENAKGA
jgi:hypothetical protein